MDVFAPGAFSHPLNLIGVISTVGLFSSGAYLYLRTVQNDAVNAVTVFIFALGMWSLSSLLVSTVADLSIQYALVYIRPTFLMIWPSLWVLSCQLYVRNNIGDPVRYWAKLFAPFAVVILLIWTHPLHGSFWEGIKLVETAGITKYTIEPGTLTILSYLLIYAYITYGLLVLYRAFTDRRDAYKRQLRILLIGAILQVGTSIYAIFYPGRIYPNVQMNPHVAALAFVFVFIAMYASGFLRIEPVARKHIVENVQSGVFIFNSDEQLVDVNQHATKLTAKSREELLGADADSAFPDTRLSREYDPDDDFTDTVSVNENGEVRIYNVQQEPIFVNNTDYAGRAIIVDDITDAERNAYELKRQNDRLEKLASALSRDLEDAVRDAMEQIQELKRDIRTGAVPEEDVIMEVRTQLHDIEQLIDDILLLTRKGKSVDEATPVSASEALETAVQNVDTPTGVQASVADEFTIGADADRLRIVFEALLENAVQHGGADEVRVSKTDEGFVVSDNGRGLPAVDGDVFQYGVTGSESDGAGLGLAIVNEIAKAHGWTVTVDDNEDADGELGGARFIFTAVSVSEAETASEKAVAQTR